VPRILWQGFTSATENKVYVDALVEFLNEVADPGFTFEFRGVDPPDRHLSRMTEWRCAIQAIGSALQAERDGVDAIILGHFQDAGLWELRAGCDVPVVGLGESSMLWACQLGFRFGLITLNPVFERWHEDQVRTYALDGRFAGVRGLEASLETFMQVFAGDQETIDTVLHQFRALGRELVDAGAEVIIPAGGLPALLIGRMETFTIDGAAVLNANAIAAKTAEQAVKLRALPNTGVSRRGTFAKVAPEAVEELISALPERRPPS
jgi:Asp/Glu/hydantoin racemase